MRQPHRRRSVPVLLAMSLLMTAAAPTARAQDDDEVRPDARVEGYVVGEKVGSKVIADQKGTSGSWAILVLLSLLCVGVTFKNGKRTHLD